MGGEIDIEHLQSWIGRAEVLSDLVTPSPLAGLGAILDHEGAPWHAGDAPPLAHWLYFLPYERQSQIDVDGHPKRGGFLPPVPLSRRMWAGGRLSFLAPLRIGNAIERRSTIADVKHRHGASGDLVFVTVRHEVVSDGKVCVSEEQDLVYREGSKAGAPATAPAAQSGAAPDVIRSVTPDPVLLFRFSALTFNSHRIHYDRDYARSVEGYEGLVVHGPLLAVLLMNHFTCAAANQRIRSFSFRAKRPLFDSQPVDLCLKWTSDGAALWSRNVTGQTTMEAEVRIF